jgi:hypothetical protein
MLGRHFFIKQKREREGATVVSTVFCPLILIYEGMALLSYAKLPLLSQVEAVSNLGDF